MIVLQELKTFKHYWEKYDFFSKRVKFFLCTPGFNFCINLESRGVKKVYFKENAVIC